MALRILLPYGMDPTIFVSFGDQSPAHTAYMHRLLGDVTTRPDFWPDGKFFFVQANDPLYLDPAQHAALLDVPLYRAQRMFFPLIVGGFGLFSPRVIVWAMLATNIIAMGIAAFLLARLALAWGLPSWLGVWAPLNIGLLFELETGGAGILAYTLCLAGVYFLTRGRPTAAALWFVAAALTKEVMLAFAAGVFLLIWLEDRKYLWRVVVAPSVAVMLWQAYIGVRLSEMKEPGRGGGNFDVPFAGIADAFQLWITHPAHLVVNVLIVVIVIMFVPVALRSRLPIAWGALPFVVLATILSAAVWRETFDLTRALSPIFAAVPFVVLRSERDRSRVPGHSFQEEGRDSSG